MGKILFIINVDWYFDLHWLERARHFKKLGFRVEVATNFTSLKIKNKLEHEDFFCHPINIARKSINPVNEVKSIIQIKRMIKKSQPSLIHCVTIKPNIYTGLINRSIPVIYSITGLGAVFSSKKSSFRVIKKAVITLYRIIGSHKKSYFIFENTDDFNQLQKDKVFTDNGRVIKGAGVNENKYYYSKPPNNNRVLFAARLLEDKGLDDLINAVNLLRADGNDIKLMVAGIIDTDAPSAIKLSDIEALAENKTIEWLGNVQDMPALIATADIVCLPTRYGEGVPRILIEAASCGRAIVATDVAGCREIIENNANGLLVPIANPQAVADAIHKIISDKKMCLDFGMKGRRKMIDEFSEKSVLLQTQAVYGELMSG